jgi:hypothetical protein
MYAQQNKSWLIDNWDFDIELIDKVVLNLDKLLKEERGVY